MHMLEALHMGIKVRIVSHLGARVCAVVGDDVTGGVAVQVLLVVDQACMQASWDQEIQLHVYEGCAVGMLARSQHPEMTGT